MWTGTGQTSQVDLSIDHLTVVEEDCLRSRGTCPRYVYVVRHTTAAGASTTSVFGTMENAMEGADNLIGSAKADAKQVLVLTLDGGKVTMNRLGEDWTVCKFGYTKCDSTGASYQHTYEADGGDGSMNHAAASFELSDNGDTADETYACTTFTNLGVTKAFKHANGKMATWVAEKGGVYPPYHLNFVKDLMRYPEPEAIGIYRVDSNNVGQWKKGREQNIGAANGVDPREYLRDTGCMDGGDENGWKSGGTITADEYGSCDQFCTREMMTPPEDDEELKASDMDGNDAESQTGDVDTLLDE